MNYFRLGDNSAQSELEMSQKGYIPITGVGWSVFLFYDKHLTLNHVFYATIYIGYSEEFMQLSETNVRTQQFEIQVLDYIQSLVKKRYYIQSKEVIGSPFMIQSSSWKESIPQMIWHYMPSNPELSVEETYKTMIEEIIRYGESLFSSSEIDENIYERYFKDMFS